MRSWRRPGAAGHAALRRLRHGSSGSRRNRRADDGRRCGQTTTTTTHGDAAPRVRHGDAHEGRCRDGDRRDGRGAYLRAHFAQVSRPTERYQRLWTRSRRTLLARDERLARLVDFMSEQMLASFKERGMPVRPWRQNKSILSKWFLPTAKSLSQDSTPAGSPPMLVAVIKQGAVRRGRRASVEVCRVVGGRGFSVGLGTGRRSVHEWSRGIEKVAMGSSLSSAVGPCCGTR